jgi:hypothetical protein
MAKVKYDLTGVEDITSDHAPVGVYRAKIANVDGPKQSSSGNQMLEIRFDLTHDATGKALSNGAFMPVWYYPLLDADVHPLSAARTKEFMLAVGLKAKGTLDTDKLVGTGVQLRLKADTDQDGDYRPKIAKVMALAAQDEPEAAEAEEEEVTAEEEDDDLDLDGMDRTALKALIKAEGLDVRVLKSMTDDDLRRAIVAAWPEDEEEDEEEEDEEEEDEEEDEEATAEAPAEEEEDEDDGYDEMTVAELKAELKERELSAAGARKILVQRLRADDSEEPF